MKTQTTKLLALAFAVLVLAAPIAAIAQESAAPAEGAASPAPAAHTKSLWMTIVEGGWVMVPIGLCSIFTVYLIVDGYARTKSKAVCPPQSEEELKGLFRAGDYVGAYEFCKENPSPLTNVMRVGIGLLGEGKQIAEEGMMAELGKENAKLQTWISYLSVVGVCTPMIGLLGTVTGMIKAFATLGSSGIGDPSSLSAAIGEVLVATASGLFIAIPAFGAFYWLRNRAISALHDIQDVVAVLFRKMPYASLEGFHIGDDELYAAQPNWVSGNAESAPQA